MIDELLKQLDFSEKEIAVYLAVLKHGKVTPGAVANIIGINRTTVYSVTKELIKKGVIVEDLGSANIYLMAKTPDDLEFLVKKEESALAEKKAIVNQAIQELQTLAKDEHTPIPKIVFVAEDEIDHHLYRQTPIWDKSILQYDGIWWGFQDQTFVQHYEKWIDWYWETGADPHTSLKLLSNEIAETIKKKKYERRQIQFWDQSKNFTATTWILGDYIVMIVTSKKPHYLVEIHDQLMAHNMREVFKGIWNTMETK